jgi:RNA polymerase sigma-70 factor (ECF subfamily)
MENLRKSFSKIYDQYIDKIYRFIFLKVNSPEISQDLTSETFLRTWEVFKNKEIKNIQAFLYKIAKNLVINYYREKEKIQFLSTEKISLDDPKENLEKKEILNSDFELVRRLFQN